MYNVADIKYEMACILYNIGALHTDLGAMDARNTPDGMKISCTHFQCAAWAFQVCGERERGALWSCESLTAYDLVTEVFFVMECQISCLFYLLCVVWKV